MYFVLMSSVGGIDWSQPAPPTPLLVHSLLKPEIQNIDVAFVSGFCHSKNNGEKRHFEHAECVCSWWFPSGSAFPGSFGVVFVVAG